MSIARSEQLKQELTDKFVVVQEGFPELRRFVGLTGQVRTVNMNCRALVQFDHPVDISWYDIDPAFLTVVPAPPPKTSNAGAKGTSEAKSAPASVPVTPPSPVDIGKKLSPLELARQQGAGGGPKKLSPLEMARQQGAAGNKPQTPEVSTEEAGKKLSPLELARQQGAAGAAAKPSETESQGAAPRKLSPLELARMQGAGGKKPAPTPGSDAEPAPKLSPLELARRQGAVRSQPAASETTPQTPEKKLSPLELARQQGAAKVSATPAVTNTEGEAPATEAPVNPEAAADQSAPAKPASIAEMLALARKQGGPKASE